MIYRSRKYLIICFFLSVIFAAGNMSVLAEEDYWSEVDAALDDFQSQRLGLTEIKDNEAMDGQEALAPEWPVSETAPVDDESLAHDPLPQGVDAPQSPEIEDELEAVSLDLAGEDALLDPDGLIGNKMIDVLQLKNMNIVDVLKLIAEKSQLNIIAGKSIQGMVTIYLKDVSVKDALRIILDANDLAYKVENGIVRVMTANEFEARYGTKFGGRLQTYIVRLKHTPVSEVLAILDQIKSSAAKVIPDHKSNTLIIKDAPAQIKVIKKLITEVDVPVDTEIFELNYARAAEIAEKIQASLTEKVGQIKVDERSNKLIVTDTDIKMAKIRRLVRTFDVKEQQVLIEAKILQITLSDQYKFGIDWEGIINKYHGLTLKSDFDILSASEKRGSISIGTLATDEYTALLEVLDTIGESNILSSPSITSLNNQEAKILVGSTQPYVTTTTTTPASGPTTTAETINFIDVGVKLYVTPIIHNDGFITMKIRPEVSSVTSTVTTSQNNTIPVVDTSEAETNVMVRDGVTIVIGGLIKDEEVGTIKKVPVLGDVPLLGLAFQNKDKLVRKTEIVIFLRPRIITGDVSARTQELL